MLERIKMILMLTCGLPSLVIVVAVIVHYELDKRKDSLLLDNSLDHRVSVFLDGEKVADLEASGARNASTRVHTKPGPHTLVARRPNGVEVEKVTFEVPSPPASGDRSHAIVCIGQKHRYVVATLVYASAGVKVDAKETDGIRFLPQPTPITVVPPDVGILALDRLDDPFLTSEKTYGSEPLRVTHLCRVAAATSAGDADVIGCSGYFR